MPATVRRRLAQIVTEVLAPAPLAIAAVLIVAWHAAGAAGPAVRWAVLGAIFAPLIPYLHLLRQVRRGHVTDRHVMRREQRPAILAVALASALAGLGLLAALGAPPSLVALLVAGAAALAVTLVVTLWWKISVHVGVIAGIITVLAIELGPRAFILLPLVLLVAWARVELGAHTPAQVAGGALLGTLVSGGVYQTALTLLG